MSKLVARGYITEGVILAFTSFFSFPKSTEYIRMVFDNTVSGLKDSLWAKNFMLTAMGRLIIMVGPNMYMVDLDVGEMFYNFRLSLILENYCGVGLVSYMGHKKCHQVKPLWIRWVRPIMGLFFFPTLPYRACYGQVSW